MPLAVFLAPSVGYFPSARTAEALATLKEIAAPRGIVKDATNATRQRHVHTEAKASGADPGRDQRVRRLGH